MAYPKNTRDKLRKAYIQGQLSLEIASMQMQVPVSTARRWKYEAKSEGDDWDKAKSAYLMSSGSLDEVGREILNGFLIQYKTVIEQLNNNPDIPAMEKVQMLSSLSDAYTKTTSASKKILPETSELSTAMEVISMLTDFVQEQCPALLPDFVGLFDKFGEVITKKYG